MFISQLYSTDKLLESEGLHSCIMNVDELTLSNKDLQIWLIFIFLISPAHQINWIARHGLLEGSI